MIRTKEHIIQDWVNEVQKDASIYFSEKCIHLCTEYPGYFIGLHGSTIKKYEDQLNKLGYTVKLIELKESFKPGDNWDAIICARDAAFFETEYSY